MILTTTLFIVLGENLGIFHYGNNIRDRAGMKFRVVRSIPIGKSKAPDLDDLY